jgi:hypothetical protein
MATNSDFEELLCEFNARDVRYLVVGGYAFSFHAKPRFTKDLALWIDATLENAQRVWDALGSFGAPLTELRPDDLAQPGTIFQIGQPPVRVDILTRLDGLSFDQAWSGRDEGRYGEQKVGFLSRADLIRNKRAVGRAQDLADVEALELLGPD